MHQTQGLYQPKTPFVADFKQKPYRGHFEHWPVFLHPGVSHSPLKSDNLLTSHTPWSPTKQISSQQAASLTGPSSSPSTQLLFSQMAPPGLPQPPHMHNVRVERLCLYVVHHKYHFKSTSTLNVQHEHQHQHLNMGQHKHQQQQF